MATSTSHYVKTVCLKDWWLIKVDDNSLHNTLAVAGIESIGQPAARVFISAPIAQRLYFCTLKTADGIFVSLEGPINKERTCENGFSEEVFKYFFIGFPSNWENCAEKCFQQGIGSEATADADLNSDEAQEEIADLQDDQNTDIDEEWSFRDARSDAQNHDKDRRATVSGHDGDACVNDDKHDSDVGFREEVVRYSLRNRKVPYLEGKRASKVKHVKNLSKSKPLSKKTMASADTSTRPLVASLKDSQTPGMTPLCDESPKENSKRPDFAITGEVNGANHAENIAARRSLSGEALSVGNSMHRIKKPHKSHKGDVMAPILQDASKANNLISHHSSVGKSRESKKGKRIERRTSQKNMVSIGSLLKKTGERTDAFATTPVTELPAQWNFGKSGGVEARGNNTENPNVRGEDESMQTKHIRSASVNTKKQSICKASTLVETNIEFSPQVVKKVVNSKSHGSKKEGKQRSILPCHGSARPTPRTSASKDKTNSKASASEIEGKTSRGSMPNLQSRRELDYAEKKTCTTEEETPSSQRSVIKTSRSGRLLLPTMEFWRNQLPIYDADHGICGIKEGSTILKLKRDEAF